MPRIPVRTEPYSSPSRQHRHFKNKRDQVLRALGKSAYINGSHFAIMWVTASGQAETYASEAFQNRLEDWFETSGIKQEGRKLILQRKGQPRSSPSQVSSLRDAFFPDDDGRSHSSDEEDSELGADDRDSMLDFGGTESTRHSLAGSGMPSMSNTPVIAGDNNDVFGGTPLPAPPIAPISKAHAEAVLASTSASTALAEGPPAGSSCLNRVRSKALAPIDTSSANFPFAQQSVFLAAPLGSAGEDGHFLRAPLSAPLPNQRRPSAPLRAPLGRSSSNANANLTQVTLHNKAARTAFYELRFGQMQQGMCKTVAKAWIKIIEPKKQTRCPYNKGEEGKPEWWPEGVRHKEPDHLMKPERHSLLLTILRSPKIKVSRLQLATAEVVAMIRADKVSLLMDVYRIAREEERLREGSNGEVDRPITVGVSTLQGWHRGGVNGEKGGLSEEGRRATMAEDSPEASKKRKSEASGSSINRQAQQHKKRPLEQVKASPAQSSVSSGSVAPAPLEVNQENGDKRQPIRTIKTDSMDASNRGDNGSHYPQLRSNNTASTMIFQQQYQQNTRPSYPPDRLRGSSTGAPLLQRQASAQMMLNTTVGSPNLHSGEGHPAAPRQDQQRRGGPPVVEVQDFGQHHHPQLKFAELADRHVDHLQQQQPPRFYPATHPHPGSMSAPQAPSAQLYPRQHDHHGLPIRQQQHSQYPHHTASVGSSPAMGYGFPFAGQGFIDSFTGMSAQSSQQQPNPQSMEEGERGGLGLQGLNMGPTPTGTFQQATTWGQAFDTGTHQQQWSSSPAAQQPQSAQHHQHRDDHALLFRAHFAEAATSNGSTSAPSSTIGPHRNAALILESGVGDDSLPELSLDMDRSFVSTSSSHYTGGPATPPTHHQSQRLQSDRHVDGEEKFAVSAAPPRMDSEKVLLQRTFQENEQEAMEHLHMNDQSAGHNGMWVSSGAEEAFNPWGIDS